MIIKIRKNIFKRIYNKSIIIIIIFILLSLLNLNSKFYPYKSYSSFFKKIIFLNLFSIKTYAQSVFDYFTEDQLLMYILYSDYKSLQQMADYYNIDLSVEEKKLRENLLKYFNLDVKKLNVGKKEILLIKSADLIFIDNYKLINANIIELFGNIYLVVNKKIFKADHIVFNARDNTVLAEGNVVFIDGNSTYYASKVSFNLKIKKGIFTDVRGKLDNYYINSKKIYAVSEKSFYAKLTSFSTCDLKNPHFHVESKKIFYSDDYILALDNTLFVGQSEILWFPLYFSLERGAGFSGNFGMEYQKREGFKFYNTWHSGKNLIGLDYYENLGIYSIFKFNLDKKINKNIKNNLKLNFGFGLGNFLFYDSSSNIWTPISPFDKKKLWNIRYGGNISLSDINFLNFAGISLYFEYYSDSYLYYDLFSNKREEKFKIDKFLKTYYPDIFPSTKSLLTQKLNLKFKILNNSIGINSYIKFYTFVKNSKYIYTPGYNEYYLYSISPFSINFGKNIININNSFFSLKNSINISSSYYYQFGLNDNADTNDTEQLQFEYNPFLKFYNMFSYSKLQSNNFRITLSMPFSVSLGNSILKYISSFYPSYNYISNYNYLENKNDISATRFNFSLNNSFLLNTGFLTIKVSILNSYIDYLEKEEDYNWNSSVLNFSFSGSFLSGILSYSFNTGVNLLNAGEKTIFYFDKRNINDLNFNFSFKPANFFYLKYLTSYKVSNFSNFENLNDIKKYDAFSFLLKTNPFYIYGIKTSLSDNLSLYYDWSSIYNKYLTNSFFINFYLKDEFSLSLNISSENKSLWVYNSFYEAFIDLLKSYNFFNIDDRISSYFNLKSISLNFKRNLHRFTLFFNITGGFVLINNVYNFKLTYSIGITSLDFKDIEYKEQIEQTF